MAYRKAEAGFMWLQFVPTRFMLNTGLCSGYSGCRQDSGLGLFLCLFACLLACLLGWLFVCLFVLFAVYHFEI